MKKAYAYLTLREHPNGEQGTILHVVDEQTKKVVVEEGRNISPFVDFVLPHENGYPLNADGQQVVVYEDQSEKNQRRVDVHIQLVNEELQSLINHKEGE